jgi:hypothetical protein
MWPACGVPCRVQDKQNGIKPAPFGGVRAGKGAVRPSAVPFNPEEVRCGHASIELVRLRPRQMHHIHNPCSLLQLQPVSCSIASRDLDRIDLDQLVKEVS